MDYIFKLRHPDESRDPVKRSAFMNVATIGAILARTSLDLDFRRDEGLGMVLIGHWF